ncbi:MAG TPA: methyltransferase domain-containing protein [Flavisolibacter sp.]|nr:methyltransferase domain-containing protein [Flavisolibacter sp.]
MKWLSRFPFMFVVMSRYFSYLNSATEIVKQYTGEEPFATYLKKFFAAHKKYGSNDRKHISNLCYSFFRLGKSAEQLTLQERIVTGLFLCSTQPNPLLQALEPAWNEKASLPVDQKSAMVKLQCENIFPFYDELSSEIDQKAFSLSHLVQPNLFIRLRPGKERMVKEKLTRAGIPFTEESASCLSLPATSKLDDVLVLNHEAVIQDLNSQEVSGFFPAALKTRQPLSVWDCCAASGGKSILVYDHYRSVRLTVSDIRQSIIRNLEKRFEEASIKNYTSFVADISIPGYSFHEKFDLVICDAPCSGSGTWGRTPEQLSFFQKEKIDHYAGLQKKIALNAARSVKEGGYFLYITCSVFEKENESLVHYISENSPLQTVDQGYCKGYTQKADTLFAALFKL